MKSDLTASDLINSPHWDGEKYAQISLPQFNINKEFLAEYLFKTDEAILDVGCGNGDTTRLLARLVHQGSVVGIDASKTMIQSALKANNPANIRFQIFNAQEINYKNEFDTVTSFFCMQWVPKKGMVFTRIHQALKQNGRFLLIVPMPHATLPAIREELIHRPKWKPYFENYIDPLTYINDCQYEFYAQQAHFEIAAYRVEQTPVIFPTYEQFFNFMSQMTPHISQIPRAKDKEIFVHELLDCYLQGQGNITSTGGYQLLFHLVKFCGRKKL